MTTIERFYLLQKKFKFRYHGIHLNRVMIFELYCLASNEIWALRTNRKLTIARRAMLFSDISIKPESKIFATFGQQDRKDHYEVFDYVVSQLKPHVTYSDLRTRPKILSIHPLIFFRSLIATIFYFGGTNISFKRKLKFAAFCTYYCNTILELEKWDLRGLDKYLSMYNATQMENLITQFMKLKGIPTYSLCEGIYVVEKENPTIDNVNHTNLETDHLLTWGKWVNDEFEKTGIDPIRLSACGYPHKTELFKIKKGLKLNNCMVLLAREQYHDTDVKLLEILSHETQYHYSIKCHPNSNIAFFKEYAEAHGMTFISRDKTVSECLNNSEYDFAIAVNTSAYYEALMRGIPCLRYTDGSFTLMEGYNDVFNSLEEYKSKMNDIQSMIDNDQYQNAIDKMLSYVMGVGLNEYRKILLGI